MISIKTNINSFIKTEFKRMEKLNRDATYAATRKVARSAKTNASKDIREEYNIKKKDLDKNIVVTNPDKNFVSKIFVKGGKESLPLIKFGKPRQKKEGVQVEVKRGNKKIIPGSFIAVMKSGHKGIFTRKGEGSKRVARLPIKELYSKAAAHIVTRKIFTKMQVFVKEKFPKVFEQEFNYRKNK